MEKRVHHGLLVVCLVAACGGIAFAASAAKAGELRGSVGCELNSRLELSANDTVWNYPVTPAGSNTAQVNLSSAASAYADYNCGLVNFQFGVGGTDYFPANYGMDNGLGGFNSVEQYGHGELDMFLRDPHSYALGLGVDYQLDSFNRYGYGTRAGVVLNDNTSYIRPSIFADYYASENVTLGVDASYRKGNQSGTSSASIQGLGAGAHVFYYPAPNMRLSLSGTVGASTKDYAAYSAHNNYYSGSFGAEYKFADTALSMFTNASYSSNNYTYSAFYVPDAANGISASVGMRFDIGPHANGTLVDLQRNGVR